MTTDYGTKIRALLAKAEGTDNEHEATTFRQAAERLMIKWGISDAMLQESGATKMDDIVEVTRTYTGIYHAALHRIGTEVTRGLGQCRPFIMKYPKSTTLYVVGFTSDVDRALLLVDTLIPQAEAAMKQWWKDQQRVSPSADFQARRTYLLAFASGARRELESIFAEEKDTTTGSELVLVNRSDRVDGWINENYGRVKASTSRMKLSSNGSVSGYAAGARAARSAAGSRQTTVTGGAQGAITR